MAHSCPECGMLCHCGGDIDDCEFENTPEQMRCGHCDDHDDDPSETEDNRQFTQPILPAWLGAGAFVFLDKPTRTKPFLVRKADEEWWLYYWHEGGKNFVTLEPLHISQVEMFRERALPPTRAAYYFPAPNDSSSATAK